MIKKLIKYIGYRIYLIGKFEEFRRNNLVRDEYFAQKAIIDKTAFISGEATIYNNGTDRSNIIIGRGSRIFGDLFTFHHGGAIEIGEDCFLGPTSRIWSAKKIKIGNRVLISHNVNIHDNISHPLDWQERHKEFVDFVNTGVHEKVDINSREIIIEDDVWIGFNAIILKGVRIGRGAIIGAGSVVVKDVEPWTVNVGSPARFVKKIED